MILKEKYTTYTSACKSLATQTLHYRCVKLCRNFAQKNVKSENSMFQTVNTNISTRQKKKKLVNLNATLPDSTIVAFPT